ncbi:hypothetical protein V8C26DRAFT_411974 [Trichoderma gracile]
MLDAGHGDLLQPAPPCLAITLLACFFALPSTVSPVELESRSRLLSLDPGNGSGRKEEQQPRCRPACAPSVPVRTSHQHRYSVRTCQSRQHLGGDSEVEDWPNSSTPEPKRTKTV